MVKLSDIAKQADVSLAVVSVVLSGKTNSKIGVSKEKREKILSIAREMNYIPNFSAQMLAGISSHTIGVLLESEDASVRFRQLASIENEAEKRGYRLLVAEAHENSDKQFQNCRILFQHGVDAVLCFTEHVNSELEKLENIIFIGPKPFDGHLSVYYDVEQGYREAAAQFRKEGRNNPALIICNTLPKYSSLQLRTAAFQSLFPGKEKNIILMPSFKNTPDGYREAFSRIVREIILPEQIDAVILQNDLWALALLTEMQEHGIAVPEQISIIGQDNEKFCSCIRPSISSIDSNLDEFAKAVIELTMKHLKNPQAAIRSIGVPTSLVLRETTKQV